MLDRVFTELQTAQIIRVKVEAVSLDSTMIKAHLDGTVALKKRTLTHWQIPQWEDQRHKDVYC